MKQGTSPHLGGSGDGSMTKYWLVKFPFASPQRISIPMKLIYTVHWVSIDGGRNAVPQSSGTPANPVKLHLRGKLSIGAAYIDALIINLVS